LVVGEALEAAASVCAGEHAYFEIAGGQAAVGAGKGGNRYADRLAEREPGVPRGVESTGDGF
jgi:hypothetical protein